MQEEWIPICFVKTHPDAQLPERKTEGAAGMDLCSVERIEIPPGEWRAVDVGFKMQLPEGLEAQIRPRSGLAAKHGVTVLNSPGTIDSDYRGPVKVLLINHGPEPFLIMCPDRIAQMVIASVVARPTAWVEKLSDTERGDGGFGSTGV